MLWLVYMLCSNAPDRALQTAFRTLGTLVEKLDINNQSIKVYRLLRTS
jgi:hypothetical protein